MKEKIKLLLDVLVGSTWEVADGGTGGLYFGFNDQPRYNGLSELQHEDEEDELNRTLYKFQYLIDTEGIWHVSKNETILLASGDFYIPSIDWYRSKRAEEQEFDYTVLGKSQFDLKCQYLVSKLETDRPVVEKIDSDDFGGLKIFLSKGYTITFFPNISSDDLLTSSNERTKDFHKLWQFRINNKEDLSHQSTFYVTTKGIKKKY
ncbi:hypothetical protein ABEP16_27420 [Priestia aryabhattai]|uniref:hypothetical protein n=1 Tax=Priestia aryabhattai TaxID=412384 RepID=UPI003D2BF1BE